MIEGEGLNLRPLNEDDSEAWHRINREDAVRKHLNPPTNESGLARLLTRTAALVPRRGYGYWAIRDDTVRSMIGFCALIDSDATDYSGEIELVCAVQSSSRCRGVATRAVRVLVRWAFNEFDWVRILGITGYENTAARSLLRRLGATKVTRRKNSLGTDEVVFKFARGSV